MKKFLRILRPIICTLSCIAVLIAGICIIPESRNTEAQNKYTVINVWQIDSFEGGKGSRAAYLKNVGEGLLKKENCIVNVVAITQDAALANMRNGNVPDIISYGAGTYGLESVIRGYRSWCMGSYCLLTLDVNSDFSDVTAENSVVNVGRNNLVSAATLFFGLRGAKIEPSANAYLKLISGNYKYLFGTQRDIYRLKTRGVVFKVYPIRQFNDLYQNISITTACGNVKAAEAYIEKLLSESENLTKIGMLSIGAKIYDNELKTLEDLQYEYKLNCPVSEATHKRIEEAVEKGDINILKNMLK